MIMGYRLEKNSRNRKKKKLAIISAIAFIFSIFSSFTTIATKGSVIEETSIINNSEVYEDVTVTWSRTPEPDGDNNPYINLAERDKEGNYLYKEYYKHDIETDTYIVNNPNATNFETGRVIVTPSTMYDGKRMEKITFDYDTMKKILNPTQTTNVWNSNNGKEATWGHHRGDLIYADSWRLFRGEFEIGEAQKGDLENVRFYIGMLDSEGEPSLIVPINDNMIVLVDGKPIGVDYTTQNQETINMKNFGLSINGEVYDHDFVRAYRSTPNPCGNKEHYAASSHTDGWHVHLDETTNNNDQGILGDITSYMNPKLGKHTLEILFGDNSIAGGSSKLEVFQVNADMDVKKSAYLLSENDDGNKTEINGTIDKGSDIYYRLQMTNTSNFNMDSAEFIDEFLNLKIDSTGIYKKDSDGNWSEKGVSLEGLTITREDETETETETGQEALDLLKNVSPNKTITIEDTKNLKYETKNRIEEIFNVENTVIVTGNFLEGKIPVVKSATATVNVKEDIIDNSITIDKSVYSINGEVIKQDEVTDSTSIKPGDDVAFKFEIKNTNNFTIANLNISDVLSGNYKFDNWTFEQLNDEGNLEKFDATSFTIETNKIINVIASGWKVQEPYTKLEDGKIDIWDYTVTNTVTLNKGTTKLDESSVTLQIEPPSLKIKKIIDDGSLIDLSPNRTFTIMVKGDDGTQYNIEAEKDKEYILSNLKYGVTYTVSEIVPMNYKLISINDEESNEYLINLTGPNKDQSVIVKNKKVNDNFWTDESKCTNVYEFIEDVLKYIKEGV